MRTIVMVTCYGLSLGLTLIGVGLVAWGILDQRSTLSPSVGLEAVGIMMYASFHVALGAAAIGAAALLAVAGREARA